MSHVKDGFRTFKAGEDLEAKRLVKIESGTTNDPPEVVYADAGNVPIGVTEFAVDDGDLVTVRLLNDAGTFDIVCDVGSAIVRGDSLYVANDGKVTEVANGTAYFQSMEAATDAQELECARLP